MKVCSYILIFCGLVILIHVSIQSLYISRFTNQLVTIQGEQANDHAFQKENDNLSKESTFYLKIKALFADFPKPILKENALDVTSKWSSSRLTESFFLNITNGFRINPDALDIVLLSRKPDLLFLNQWREFFQGYHFIIMQEGNSIMVREIPDWVDYELYITDDMRNAFGKKAWIISSKNAPIHNLGFLVSKKEYILSLDDDCFPAKDTTGYLINPITAHLQNLQSPTLPFFNAQYDTDRNIDIVVHTNIHNSRSIIPTAISYGSHNLYTRRESMKHESAEEAFNHPLHYFCRQRLINFAFSRELIGPTLMHSHQGSLNPLIGPVDVFSVFASNAISDHLQLGIKSGLPFIEKENFGYTLVMEKNQMMWDDIIVQFFDRSVNFSSLSNSSQKAYLELSDILNSTLGHLHPYFSLLALSMKVWVEIWDDSIAGRIKFTPSRVSSESTSNMFHPLNIREKSHNPFAQPKDSEEVTEFQRLINILSYWGPQVKKSIVTKTDLSIGQKWKTYLYPLSDDFHRGVFERFNVFGCLDTSCSLAQMDNLPQQYVDHAPEIIIFRKLIASLNFVTNPDEADLFLVPAFGVAALWYYSPSKDVRGCRNYGVCENQFFESLQSKLFFLNTTKKHLFLATQDSSQNHAFVREQSIRPSCRVADLGPGKLVVPSLNPFSVYQPSQWNGAVPLEKRETFLLANFGVRIKDRILAHAELLLYNGTKKIEMNRVKSEYIFSTIINYTMHMNSIFVLCLSGDLPYTKRIFDAWIAVAIPVVIPYFHNYGKSYFSDEECVTPHADFKPRLNNTFPHLPKLSYSDIVIELPREFLLNGTMMKFLESIPEHVIREKLKNIEKVRPYFLYDFDGFNEDAFTIMLQNLEMWVLDL